MAVRGLKKIEFEDEATNRAWVYLQSVLTPILQSTILDGELVTNVELTSGVDNVVRNPLGREIIGWIPVRVRAEANIWDQQDSSSSKKSTLTLRTSADVEVDLWIF